MSLIFVSSTFSHVRESIRIGNLTKFPLIWREKMIKMNRIQRNLKNIIYILLFGVFFNFLSKPKFSFFTLGEIGWNEIKFSEILIEMSMILLCVLQILCNTSFLLFASLYLIIAHNFVNFLICVTKSCCLAFFFFVGTSIIGEGGILILECLY